MNNRYGLIHRITTEYKSWSLIDYQTGKMVWDELSQIDIPKTVKKSALRSRIIAELELVAVLKELLDLKELKDAYGETDDYLKRQPLAWDNAKKLLNEYRK